MWDTYQEGKLTLEEYLGWVVFYQKRPFTRTQFRRFMFAQSKPNPEMIGLAAQLRVRHGLKIAVVSNEKRELNAYRIGSSSSTGLWILLFSPASSISSSPMRTSFGLHWTSPRHQPGRSSISKTYDVRRDRGRFGYSRHASYGLQVYMRETDFVRIADWRADHP
jgi:hypothetical protein